MIKIELDDKAFHLAIAQLKRAGGQLRPLLQDIGEHLVETTKRRFDTSRAPDGSAWAPNRPITYARYLDRFKGSHGKDGRLSKRGAERAAAKKPLIGESRALSTTIHYTVSGERVDVGSSMVYAAVQQFGAKARSFTGGKSPWGDIPARPFLGLSAEDGRTILDMARDYLAGSAGGG